MYYNTKTYTFSLTKHTLKNYGDERPKASILMSTTWNIWKGRNCQVFHNLRATPAQVEEEMKRESG